MKELKCSNCNSNDLSYENGLWVCKHCGSKFIPDNNEKPDKSIEDKLVDKMYRLFEKRENYQGLSEKDTDKRLELNQRIEDCIREIIMENDKSPYAFAGRFILHISDTFESQYKAERVLDNAEKALDYADKEEKEDIVASIKPHFLFHCDRIMVYPELKERCEAVRKRL